MGSHIKLFLVLVTFGYVIVSATENMPIAFDTFESLNEIAPDLNYRLNQKLKDIGYKITINVPKNFENDNKFTGKVEITFTPTEVFTEKKFLINAADLILQDSAKLLLVAEPPGESLLTGAKENIEAKYQITGYTTKSELTAAPHIFEVSFEGQLQSNLYGFYKTKYKNAEKNDEYVLATHFEPTNARRLMPCFDEPHYKATFTLIVYHPKEYTVISNTKQVTSAPEGDLQKTTFTITPHMSTYLLAIVVSKFKQQVTTVDTIPHSVYAQNKYSDEVKTYALRQSAPIIKAMEDFTNNKFAGMHIDKIDHVALPDFNAGAMENWGLITYRESMLLHKPYETPTITQMRVFTVVAHELAHFWFGNLKTTDWWDTIWLNEGFARYFQYMAANQVDKEWDLDKLFVVEQHFGIMNQDAISPKALNEEVSSPEQIKAKFDSFSYNKGASVIRMMSLFNDYDKFKDGLKAYIALTKLSVVPQDLWTEMKDLIPTQAGIPTVAEVMKTYTEKPGVPLLEVKITEKKVEITQKQFRIPKPDEQPKVDETYFIPITCTFKSEEKALDFEKTKPMAWIGGDKPKFEFELDTENDLYFINIQASAYARVLYPVEYWGKLKAALAVNELDKIHVLNRVQLVEDSLAFARGGYLDYDRALDFVSYLENEVSYYPWYSAFRAFDYMLSKLPSDSPQARQLKLFILFIMDKVHKTDYIHQESRHIKALRKSLTTSWRCNLGQPDCITEMVALFEKVINGQEIDPDLRSTAYCVGLRESNDEEKWEKLYTRYKETNTPSEAALLLPALGCSKIPAKLIGYLDDSLVVGSEIIRQQDRKAIFTYVLNGNPDNVKVVATYFTEKYDNIKNSYPNLSDRVAIGSEILNRYTNENDITEFINGFKDSDADLKAKLDEVAPKAKANIKWATDYKDKISGFAENFLKGKGGGGGGGGGGGNDDGGAGSIIASSLLIVCNIFIALYLTQ